LETPNITTCGLSAWTSDIPVSTHPAYFVPDTDLGPEIPTKKSFILTLLSCIFCLSSLYPCCYIALMNSQIELNKSFSTVSGSAFVVPNVGRCEEESGHASNKEAAGVRWRNTRQGKKMSVRCGTVVESRYVEIQRKESSIYDEKIR
jgi:hypothetical protein